MQLYTDISRIWQKFIEYTTDAAFGLWVVNCHSDVQLQDQLWSVQHCNFFTTTLWNCSPGLFFRFHFQHREVTRDLYSWLVQRKRQDVCSPNWNGSCTINVTLSWSKWIVIPYAVSRYTYSYLQIWLALILLQPCSLLTTSKQVYVRVDFLGFLKEEVWKVLFDVWDPSIKLGVQEHILKKSKTLMQCEHRPWNARGRHRRVTEWGGRRTCSEGRVCNSQSRMLCHL